MKVYIYHNGLCDPNKNIGMAKQFADAEDIDDYINLFCSHIDPKFMNHWRIFITNDEIDFMAVDHFVLMNEHLTESIGKKIEEIDVKSRALVGNVELISRERKLSEKREKARRAQIDRRAEIEAKKQEYIRDLTDS